MSMTDKVKVVSRVRHFAGTYGDLQRQIETELDELWRAIDDLRRSASNHAEALIDSGAIDRAIKKRSQDKSREG
jgi:hypothetical protein